MGELTDWCSSVISPVIIVNQTVEMVHNYKYFDTNIDDNLSFNFNPKIRNDLVCKKAQQLCFYTKLTKC